MMDKPTAEEIQRFWEGHGLFHNLTGWFAKNERGYYQIYLGEDLPIDLNNLFEWAVPKLFTMGFWMQLVGDGIAGWDARIHHLSRKDYYFIYQSKDPALALFWALDKVREGG